MALGAVGGDLPGRFRAVIVRQALRQPQGHGIHDGQIFCSVALLGPMNLILMLHQAAQHGVDHAGKAIQLHFPGQLHSLVHRSAVGHPVMQQNLARARAQDIAHRQGQGIRIPQEGGQGMIQIIPVFQRAVYDAGAQPPIQLVQVHRAQAVIQGQGGIGFILQHVSQHVHRHQAGIGVAARPQLRAALGTVLPHGSAAAGAAGAGASVPRFILHDFLPARWSRRPPSDVRAGNRRRSWACRPPPACARCSARLLRSAQAGPASGPP